MCIWAKSQRRRKASVWENSSSVAGEAADQIRGDGGPEEVLPQQSHGPEEPGGVIPAIHAPQGGVAAGLHGQVELGAEVGEPGGPAAEILRHGAGLQTTQPQAHLSRRLRHRLQQVDEAAAVLEILSPRGDLDAGKDHLPVALPPQLLRLAHRLLQRQGPHRPPCIGDDAVGAEVDAAVLHLQHGPCPGRHAPGGQHLEGAAAQGLIHRHTAAVILRRLLQQGQKLHPVAGAADEVDAQLLSLRGVGLHIAAAGSHHGLGIAALGPADHLPGFFIADGGDGAGIDDVGIRRGLKVHQRVATPLKLLLHGLRLILVDLAAEGVNSNSHGDSPCTLRFSPI